MPTLGCVAVMAFSSLSCASAITADSTPESLIRNHKVRTIASDDSDGSVETEMLRTIANVDSKGSVKLASHEPLMRLDKSNVIAYVGSDGSAEFDTGPQELLDHSDAEINDLGDKATAGSASGDAYEDYLDDDQDDSASANAAQIEVAQEAQGSGTCADFDTKTKVDSCGSASISMCPQSFEAKDVSGVQKWIPCKVKSKGGTDSCKKDWQNEADGCGGTPPPSPPPPPSPTPSPECAQFSSMTKVSDCDGTAESECPLSYVEKTPVTTNELTWVACKWTKGKCKNDWQKKATGCGVSPPTPPPPPPPTPNPTSNPISIPTSNPTSVPTAAPCSVSSATSSVNAASPACKENGAVPSGGQCTPSCMSGYLPNMNSILCSSGAFVSKFECLRNNQRPQLLPPAGSVWRGGTIGSQLGSSPVTLANTYGKQLQMLRIFMPDSSRWQKPVAAAAEAHVGRGGILWYNIDIDHWQSAVSGGYDNRIQYYASQVKGLIVKYSCKVLVCLKHEPDSKPGFSDANNTPTDIGKADNWISGNTFDNYKKMWGRTQHIFAQEGVPSDDVAWAMDYSRRICPHQRSDFGSTSANLERLWPGGPQTFDYNGASETRDVRVDWLFFNIFEKDPPSKYGDFDAYVKCIYDHLSKTATSSWTTNWGVGAYGTHSTVPVNERAVFINQAQGEAERIAAGTSQYPNLKAFVYYDSKRSAIGSSGTAVFSAYQSYMNSGAFANGDGGMDDV